MNKITILLSIVLSAGMCVAQPLETEYQLEDNPGVTYKLRNPICPMGVYIADPTSRVAPDGRLYIYGSLDTTPEQYCSKDYHVLSTSDLSNWTLNRYSFTCDKVMYAPDLMYKNGMYYLYYENPNGDEFVAESKSPVGPFHNGIKIEGPLQIDPNVFIDDDGQAYYFWGQFSAKGAKMNADMKTIDQSTIVDGIVNEDNHFFHEGSYVIKRGKYYYYIFADISRNSRPTCLGYAMATSPFGPYEYKGVIIDNAGCDPETWNNHGSLVEYKGKWYVLYHRSTHASRSMRKACIEPIKFNADGTIPEVEMTSQGACGPIDAFEKIPAGIACKMHGNVRIQRKYNRGDIEELGCIRNGDNAEWKYIDFGRGAKNVSICLTSKSAGKILLYTDNFKGKPIATIDIKAGLNSEIVNVPIKKIKGVHALCMKYVGNDVSNDDLFNIDWFMFDDKKPTSTTLFERLEAGFKHIPDTIQTAVYWYWLNNNVTREGVVRDLEAMKRVGINRAFIGNHSTGDLPYGKHKLFSNEWWATTHQALKTASELGIDIGIFNCPGWSQSGGPWITPKQSMKYAEIHVQSIFGDGEDKTIVLPKVDKSSIISVLAYPSIKAQSQTWTIHPDASNKRITLTLDKPFTARSIEIKSDRAYRSNVRLESNGEEIKSFEFDRHNTGLNVGFKPLAPCVVTIPETNSNQYEISFDNPSPDVVLTVTIFEKPYVERYAEKSLSKVFQDPLPMWDYYMWDTPAEASARDLYINPDNIIDLSSKIHDGKIVWSAPQGEWTISTLYMKSTGVTNSPAVAEGTGLEVDKINKKYISSHFDAYIGEILRRVPAQDRTSFSTVVEDSYETGSLNWTDDMTSVFQSTYSYNPIPYLPTLYGNVVGSVDKSDRFLWDLRRLIADRVAYDYVGGLRQQCNQHGMKSWLENYGHWGFPSEFLIYGSQSDEVSGEFWSEGSLGDIENRAASSCAHIYGKQKVWAESCTAAGAQFNRYPRLMKQRIDHFFCEGINASLLHLFISQPDNKKPGLDAWFGNEFNRNNSWFEGMTTFIDYLKRCSMMLQQGRYVADVAYFIGEDVPKMTGTCDPPLPKGYSFDYINGDVILNHSKVVDGKLILDSGMSYNLLVLPKQTTMRPQILERIHQFVEQGLTIVGPRSQQSPSMQDYPNADNKVRNLASQIWNDTGKCGNGRGYNDGTPIETILRNQSIEPDFSYTGQASLEFIHRTLNDEGEIYFISNQEDSIRTANLSFRASKWTCAELWNPQTGETRYLECNKTSNRIEAEITLAHLESVFVVFSNKAVFASDKTSHTTKITIDREPWKVYFAPSAGKPSFTKSYTKLEDWTLAKDDDIKYYSGNATYSNSFILQKQPGKDAHVKLNIGEVMVLATVKINGHDAGGVWTYPYSLDITPYVRQGENRIEITVYNNWRNRLIADEKLPASERLTWTNIQPWSKTDGLQHSGLLKPVSIEIDE